MAPTTLLATKEILAFFNWTSDRKNLTFVESMNTNKDLDIEMYTFLSANYNLLKAMDILKLLSGDISTEEHGRENKKFKKKRKLNITSPN